jgi:hypothetical protein
MLKLEAISDLQIVSLVSHLCDIYVTISRKCVRILTMDDLMYAFPLGVAAFFAFLIVRKEML